MHVFLNTLSMFFFNFVVSSNSLNMYLKKVEGQVALFEAASKPFEKTNILNSLKCTNDKNRSYVVQK